MGKPTKIQWFAEPEEQDYPDAESFLRLIYAPPTARALVDRLRNAPVSTFKAKDIFRASGLSLLGISNAHIKKDQQKIEEGKKLSPVLLVRDEARGRLVIADGYHRMCAVYTYDEDADIPCKIV